MRFISSVIFLYIWISLVLVLPIKWRWKLLLGLPLLIFSQRFLIMSLWGGSVFYSPEIPRWMLMTLAFFHALFIIIWVVTVCKDLLWLLWSIVRRWVYSRLTPFPRIIASLAVLGSAIVLTAWGLFMGTAVPGVKAVDIGISGLPADFDGMRCVVLSDLHFSALNDADFSREVVGLTNRLGADAVFILGDTVDGAMSCRRNAMLELGKLQSSQGVFFIPGNHEYFTDYGEWSQLVRSLPNAVLLENSHILIKSPSGAAIAVAGVTDDAARRCSLPASDVPKALNGIAPETSTILLAHRPILANPARDAGVDLVLSGHTHGGMITGLKSFVGAMNGSYVSGLYDLGKTRLYVSNGAGIWNGFPIRIGAPPEILLITLRRVDSRELD